MADPLRNIVEVMDAGSTWPARPATERLECGHVVQTWGSRADRLGKKRRRCRACTTHEEVRDG